MLLPPPPPIIIPIHIYYTSAVNRSNAYSNARLYLDKSNIFKSIMRVNLAYA